MTIHAEQGGHRLYVPNVLPEVCTLMYDIIRYLGNQNMQPYIPWKIQKLEILDTLPPFPHFIAGFMTFPGYGVHSICFFPYTPNLVFELGKLCVFEMLRQVR